jgi:hypothetical protein
MGKKGSDGIGEEGAWLQVDPNIVAFIWEPLSARKPPLLRDDTRTRGGGDGDRWQARE